MRLIKLALWILVTICMAYFITDFKIGNLTIKQRLDTFIKSEDGVKVRQNVTDWVNKNVSPNSEKSIPQTPITPKNSGAINKGNVEKKVDEDKTKITNTDESALTKILKEAPVDKATQETVKKFLDE